MKLSKRVNPYDYEVSDLFGKWKFKDGRIILYQDQNSMEMNIKINLTNGQNEYGKWELEKQQLNIELIQKSKTKQLVFSIDELGSHILIYYINGNKYSCFKEK